MWVIATPADPKGAGFLKWLGVDRRKSKLTAQCDYCNAGGQIARILSQLKTKGRDDFSNMGWHIQELMTRLLSNRKLNCYVHCVARSAKKIAIIMYNTAEDNSSSIKIYVRNWHLTVGLRLVTQGILLNACESGH